MKLNWFQSPKAIHPPAMMSAIAVNKLGKRTSSRKVFHLFRSKPPSSAQKSHIHQYELWVIHYTDYGTISKTVP